MEDPLQDHDASGLAQLVRRGAVSAGDAVQESLAAIERLDGLVNAFTVVFAEAAVQRAAELERRVSAGEDLGPLAGVPIAIKDAIWIEGEIAANGSRARADFRAPRTAVAVSRLLAADAVIVGKTTNPELCYRGITSSELFGTTNNPWDPGRTPGGSSGGSSAAVAYGAVPLTLGSDGGGSIRAPSSFCGVAGHKPSMGIVPRGPGFRGWETLSVVGPIGRSARDLAAGMQVLAGYDASDELSFPRGARLADTRKGGPETLRIAFSSDLGYAPVESNVREVFDSVIADMEAAGWNLEPAHPAPHDSSRLWTILAICEGYAADRDLLESPSLLEHDTRELIEAGSNYSAADYLDAQYQRADYTRSWQAFFEEYDALLTPAMQMTAFEHGILAPSSIDGQPVDPFFDDWGAFCFPANLTGAPATVVPGGYDSAGMPVGIQFTASSGCDDLTIALACAWEDALGDERRRPRVRALGPEVRSK